MNKNSLLFVGPVTSRSGYGAHARDIVESIIKLDKYNVSILPIRWGNCPLNAIDEKSHPHIFDLFLKNTTNIERPDISVQVTIPTEFNAMANYNVGITAGIETTICAASWIEGLNRMDLNIVPSKFSKQVFENTKYSKMHEQTKQMVGELKIEKPIEVLFEGVDTNIYDKNVRKESTHFDNIMNGIKEDFCYLLVGHWLQGNLGSDRKNIGMSIKVFLETFKNNDNAPALILKTGTTFSAMDYKDITNKINQIKQSVEATVLPSIYVVFGDLSDDEMNLLYNHDKVKAMLNLTRGEGFGRPLLEFSLSGKPIIASGWSGHLDFLNPEFTVLLPGKLEQVDGSAVNEFILPESQWFTVDYSVASKAMFDVFTNYNRFLSNAKKQYYDNKRLFSIDVMTHNLNNMLEKYVNVPIKQQLVLPKLIKADSTVGSALPNNIPNVEIKLPKLEKV